MGLLASMLIVVPARAAVLPTAAAGSVRGAAAPLVTGRADAVSAMLAARAQGLRVEVTGDRTATSTTWANPDGTWTVDTASQPVRFKDPVSGVWRDIDLSLSQAADGSVRPAGSPYGLSFAGPGGAPGQARDVVSMAKGTERLSVQWPGVLPRPVVAGTSTQAVRYPGVGAGVDLEVTPLRTGVEASLVLTARPAAGTASYTIPVSTAGLTVTASAGGGATLTDAHGVVQGVISMPVMWDARVDAASGEHVHQGRVAMSVRRRGAVTDLVLTPDPAFLADPATVFPVTIDPSMTFTDGADLYTSALYPSTAYYKPSDLRVGTYDAGADKTRSYLAFNNWPNVRGTHVLSASLVLFDNWSYSCTARAVQVWEPSAQWTYQTTWNTQPGLGKLVGSASFAAGYSSSCPASYESIDVTPLAADWSTYAYNWGQLVLTASSETDNYGWKKFNSAEKNGTGIPYISVTYNSYPNTPTSPAPASGSYTATATPTLSAVVSDPDGGSVQGRFYLKDVTTNTWVSPSTGTYGTTVTSGGTSSWTAPALTDGDHYQWQVYASDTLPDLSLSAAGWFDLYVDTTAPATPSISSGTFAPSPALNPGGSGSFTFATPSTDVAAWRYSWDGVAWTGIPTASSSVSVTLTPPTGADVLRVQAVDRAGNYSPAGTYSFSAGAAAVTSPADAQRTQAYVTLDGQGPYTATSVRFQYTLPGGTFTDIPVGDVTLHATPVTAWPLAVDTSNPAYAGAPANLVWNVAATLGHVDGPVQVRAVFSDGTTSWTSTGPVTVTLDQQGLGLAGTSLGPVAVSLLTGDAQVAATDASVTSSGTALSVSRTFNSFDPAAPGIFGPGWASSVPVDSAGVAWARLQDLGSSVRLVDSGGGLSFLARSGSVYTPVGDAAGLALAAGTHSFVLTDVDGTRVTFTNAAATPGAGSPSSPVDYALSQVLEPASQATPAARTSTYAYNADGSPAAVYAPPAIVAGSPVSCTPAISAGCRALVFSYVTVAGRSQVAAVTLKTADGSGAPQQVDLACYLYDATSGRLTSEWDPRITGSACPAYGTAPTAADLPTSYGYDSAGRVTSIGPPGLAAWTLGYDTTVSPARLATVARTHDAAHGGGTETSTLVYGVPFGATAGADESHPDLSAARAALWGQADLPVTATAVYSPGDTVSASDLRDGQVYAIDVSGRVVNTAGFSGTGQAGWKVTTTEYDTHGNTVRTLSAADRDRALSPDPVELTALGLPTTASATNSPAIAAALDTRTYYTADGVDATDTFGPLHLTALSTGATVPARTHTHTSYGSVDYPTVTPTDWVAQAPAHQPQAVTTAASASATPFGATDQDVTTVTTAYGLSATDHTGWDFRVAMRTTTVMPGGADIVTETRYDPTTGAVIEQRQPSAAGTTADPGTRVTTYYTAGTLNLPGCVNSAWYGQVCTTGPGAQPTTAGLPDLPVTTTTYDALLRPVTVTETVAGTTRTTTSSYASAWSPQLVSTAVTGGTGTAVPATTTSYDPATGLPTVVSDGTHAITTVVDDFGRETQRTSTDTTQPSPGYVDRTATSYDTAGRLATVTYLSADLATQIGQTSYGYDAGTEHRGLVTSLTQSGVGTLTGSYDADGALATQTWPNGTGGAAMDQTWVHDPTGDTTSLTYTQAGVTWLGDTQTSNAQGQWTIETGQGLPFTSRGYSYDAAGRLIAVAEKGTPGDTSGCVTRTYAYTGTAGLNSNRTNRTAYPADATGACSTTTTPIPGQTQTFSYDNADRMLSAGTATGIGYDTFGRITTAPATMTGGPADITLGYYSSDLVRSMAQTVAGTTTTRTYYLDAAGRLACSHTQTAGTTPTGCGTAPGDLANHYGDGSDSPAWTLDTPTGGGATTTHWYPTGLDGQLAADVTTTNATTTVTYQIVGLHGDVLDTTSQTATTSPDGIRLYTDEYGVTTNTTRYGWLGGKKRPTDGLSGLTLMGVRIYNPTSGRFLSTDPIYGGNPNAYAYPGDPVNAFDLYGNIGWRKFFHDHWLDIALTAITLIPAVGEAAWAVRGALTAVRVLREARTMDLLAVGVRSGGKFTSARASNYVRELVGTRCPVCGSVMRAPTRALRGVSRDMSEIQRGHIISRFNGGNNSLINLRGICARCNSIYGPRNMPF